MNSLKENFTNAVKKDKQDKQNKDHIDTQPETPAEMLLRVEESFSAELILKFVRDHTEDLNDLSNLYIILL